MRRENAASKKNKCKKTPQPIVNFKIMSTFATAKTGKSYTASSLRILQGLIAAKVVGCSGAI